MPLTRARGWNHPGEIEQQAMGRWRFKGYQNRMKFCQWDTRRGYRPEHREMPHLFQRGRPPQPAKGRPEQEFVCSRCGVKVPQSVAVGWGQLKIVPRRRPTWAARQISKGFVPVGRTYARRGVPRRVA